jgi:hypothetical protein
MSSIVINWHTAREGCQSLPMAAFPRQSTAIHADEGLSMSLRAAERPWLSMNAHCAANRRYQTAQSEDRDGRQ